MWRPLTRITNDVLVVYEDLFSVTNEYLDGLGPLRFVENAATSGASWTDLIDVHISSHGLLNDSAGVAATVSI